MGQVEQTIYDVAGRVLSKTDFNGKVTTFGYDTADRLVLRTPDASFAGEVPVSWTYSATGRRLTMTDATGVTTYGYDSRDRLASKATPEGTLSYTRDLSGHVATVRSDKSDGVAVDYGWDEDSRLATVTDRGPGSGSSGLVTTYGYDTAGRMLGWVQPNGVATKFTYDSVNHLQSDTITNAASSVLASYTYTLSATGNRTGVVEASGRAITWRYDNLYRLTGETITGSASANGAIGYTYDAVGNRLSRTSSVTGIAASTSTYDANDRVSGETFDSNGDQLTRDGKTQSFDSQDRLVSSAASSAPSVHVYYDGDGNRVAVDVGGALVSYLVDDGENPTGYPQVVEERVGGNVQRAYVFGMFPLSQRAKSGASWAFSYYEMNGHGDVVVLTDGSGSITDSYEYEAFGGVVARTGSTYNPLTYSGEWFDSDQGIQYLRARWYSPGVGRFVSPDTVETPDGAYRYTRNNPVSGRDPTGHDTLLGEMMQVGIQNVLATLAQPGTNDSVVSRATGATVDVYVQVPNYIGSVRQLVDVIIERVRLLSGGSNRRRLSHLTRRRRVLGAGSGSGILPS
jgi:RHS repeat-associated protein